MKIAEQRRQIGTTMTHVSRIVEELVESLEGASRRVVPGAEPGGGARELLDATRALLDDLTPVALRQDLSPAPALVDSLIHEVDSAIAPRLDRMSVVAGNGVSVRTDLGGRRLIKKTTT